MGLAMARQHLLFGASAALSAALAGCFTGGFLAGQPCRSDADCGPALSCEGGVCGGNTASAASTTGTTTPVDPTLPTTTIPDATTTTTVTPDPTTSTGPDVTTTTIAMADTDTDSTTEEPCGIGRCKDLDLLLVLDNSPSMGEDLNALIGASLAFQEEFLPVVQKACSVHLGVTTTDPGYAANPPECQKQGALVRASGDGTPCTFTEGKPYATMPDILDTSSLTCMFNVGSSGSDNEQPIGALLSLPMNPLNDPGQCNDGFLRADAFHVVIVVTDEDDDDNDAQGHSGSGTPTALWTPSFKGLYGPTGNVLLLGVFGDPDPQNTMCPWDPFDGPDGSGAESAPNLRAFVEGLPEERRVIGSLCQEVTTEVYDEIMQEITSKLNAACGV